MADRPWNRRIKCQQGHWHEGQDGADLCDDERWATALIEQGLTLKEAWDQVKAYRTPKIKAPPLPKYLGTWQPDLEGL